MASKSRRRPARMWTCESARKSASPNHLHPHHQDKVRACRGTSHAHHIWAQITSTIGIENRLERIIHQKQTVNSETSSSGQWSLTSEGNITVEERHTRYRQWTFRQVEYIAVFPVIQKLCIRRAEAHSNHLSIPRNRDNSANMMKQWPLQEPGQLDFIDTFATLGAERP